MLVINLNMQVLIGVRGIFRVGNYVRSDIFTTDVFFIKGWYLFVKLIMIKS